MNKFVRFPRDAALPQMALTLNGPAMLEVFAQLLRQQSSPTDITSCEVDRIKYRPARNLAVSYRLAGFDRESGERVEQLVAARFCGEGDAAPRHEKALRGESVATAMGPQISHLPSLHMVAHWWPNDAKLGHSAACLGGAEAARNEAVRGLVAALSDGRGIVLGHRWSAVQVVPEHRACARVELDYCAEPGAAAVSCAVYAKADASMQAAKTHSIMLALHQSEAQRDGRLWTPRPLLWQESSGLHWQAALPGSLALTASAQVGEAASPRVGALLAAFHSVQVAEAPAFSAQEAGSRQRMVAETLLRIEPRWSLLIQSLATALNEGLAGLSDASAVTLHTDLHPGNIIVHQARHGLIDLDGVRSGPAVLDLGDWIGDSLYRALLAGTDVATALVACRLFQQAYAHHGGERISEATLAWATANSLFCQRAWRCAVNLKPGRFALVEPLLELACAIARAGSIDAAMLMSQRQAA